MKYPFALLLLLLWGCGVSSPCGAAPTLTSIRPFAFQVGAHETVKVTGNRLNEEGIQLLSYTEGITLADWKCEKPTEAEATLHVGDEVPNGLHAVRLVSGRGISELVTIYVGRLPRVDEVEPNPQPDKCQALTGECMVAGNCRARDEDWYEFEVPSGWQRLSIEIHGLRLGNRLFDPVLEVYAPDGRQLGRYDDTPLARQDPFVVIHQPMPGKYRCLVRDAMYRGAGDYVYLLHIGQFPRPSFAIPDGAAAGSTVDITWHDARQVAFTQQVAVPADADSEISVLPQDEFGTAPSPVPLQVAPYPIHQEVEPNDEHASAGEVVLPQVVQGRLDFVGDVDFFKFRATKGQQFRFQARSRREVRSPVDAVVTLFDSKRAYISSNDDAGGPDSLLDYTIPEDGEYFVSVRDFLRRGGSSYWYRLTIAPPVPQLTLLLPERQRNRSITLEVPQGNRMAVLVRAQRADQGGAVSLQLAGLPAGATVEAPTVPGNFAEIPLLVSCEATTPQGGSLLPLTGVAVTEQLSVPGKLAQRQLLVAGQNNRDMWGYDTDRLAMAITQPVPFRLELVAPKVPLVRGGLMHLKVNVVREEGFDAPITVFPLDLPPGVSGLGSVTIPEKQNAIEYVLNANERARLGTPSLVLLGRARVQDVDVEVATGLVPVTIGEPRVALQATNVSLHRGGQCEMVMPITIAAPFDGEATAELLNLPAGVTAELVKFSADAKTLTFQLQAQDDARLGRTGGILCQVVITEQGEPITHRLPAGQVRVDPAATAVAGT